MTVVSDSSPLIVLSAIGQLQLLKHLYGRVSVPPAVWREVVTDGGGRPGAKEVAEAPWIERVSVQRKSSARRLAETARIKTGESEAIALAKELNADWLIVDDGPARRTAEKSEIRVIGTLGILLAAKEKGLIAAVKPLVDMLAAQGLRVSPKLYQAVL